MAIHSSIPIEFVTKRRVVTGSPLVLEIQLFDFIEFIHSKFSKISSQMIFLNMGS